MIHSVIYRHDGASALSNYDVSSSLKQLTKYLEQINRVKIVFYKDNHHQHHDSLITCHLSLFAPSFGSVEIYAHQQCEKQAFQSALNKAKKKLKRLVSKSRAFSHETFPIIDLEATA